MSSIHDMNSLEVWFLSRLFKAEVLSFFKKNTVPTLHGCPSGDLHVLHPTFLCWHYSAGRAGIRCRALSLLLPWYVTLLNVPFMGSHHVSHVGMGWCDRDRQVGMGPWWPALVPPSWQSSTTLLSLSDHMWHPGTQLEGEPHTREIPQPCKAWVWAPALAGNQQKVPHGSLMSWEWDLAGLKVMMAGDISPWDRFCCPWVFQHETSN